MPVSPRRAAAVLAAAVVSVTGLTAVPAQAAPAAATVAEARVLLPAAYTVQGAIRAEWVRLGGARGVLGQPTGPERRLANGGYGQTFQGGSIHWSPGNGAHATKGAIRTAWARAGWEGGALGYPAGDERRLRNGGYGQTFQGGSIHWSPGNGAHVTKGAIRAAWARAGWESGRYGYPTGDEYRTPTGWAQRFQGGVITWTAPAPRPNAGVYQDRDCSDFTRRRDAQAFHDRWRGLSDLDGNNDGEACEMLPW